MQEPSLEAFFQQSPLKEDVSDVQALRASEVEYALYINKRNSEKLWNSIRYIYLHGRIGETIAITVNQSPHSTDSKTFNTRVEGLKGDRVYLSIPFEEIIQAGDELW